MGGATEWKATEHIPVFRAFGKKCLLEAVQPRDTIALSSIGSTQLWHSDEQLNTEGLSSNEITREGRQLVLEEHVKSVVQQDGFIHG